MGEDNSRLSDTDYREKYLDQRFKNLDAKLDTIIGYQKTAAKESERYEERIDIIEKKQLVCPVGRLKLDFKDMEGEIEIVKQDIEDLRYYKKHPGQLKMLLWGFLFVTLMSMVPLINLIYNWIKK